MKPFSESPLCAPPRPFILSLSKDGRPWFDGLTTNGFSSRKCTKAIRVLTLVLGLAVASFPQGKTSDPTAVDLITKMQDKLNLEGADVTSTFTLIQRKEGEADRVLKIRVFRRDAAQKFTLIFQYPESEKGKGYFRNGDNLYLYLPSTREFVFRNRKDDVGSTDVRTDLFGRLDLLKQYTVTDQGSAQVSKFDCNLVLLNATALDVSFPIQKWYIRKTDGLPVKVENFSASNTLLRTFFYIDYKEVKSGKFLFTKLMAVNNLEKNQKTFLTNDDISGAAIPDYTFSQAYLEEQSR